MSLRSLPLRLKLAVALVLPMLLVIVLIGDRVSGSVDERRVAASQQDEAARLEAVADYGDAVGAESVITNDPTATEEQLAGARAATDAALERLQDPSLGLDPEVIRRIGINHAELVEIRGIVGDSPADISLRFQLEAYVEPVVGSGDPAAMLDTVPNALARMYKLPTTISAEFEFAEASVVDVETSKLLADYELVQRLRDDHVQEVSVLLQLAATPPTLIDGAAIEQYRGRVVETDFSRSLIYDYAAQDLVSDVSASRRSPAGSEYALLRAAADNTEPGVAAVTDIEAINRSGSVVTSQYTALSDEVVDSIRSQAERTASAATTSLVLVLLAGAWMLVIAGIVLRLLFRSIRSPLQRLTEQSQHIANVELPYVVSAMRGGELDQAPTTSDLVADSNDEIGDLVHAFNDMHRTAVELAAEQAGSRRVVADMFVNLGRRNQRLVNRLLKRLTNLERDERDPDKLAGLYEIDHVVTRMRRNAESLLVLAGASQSRKWDRPVEVYDIAQAALSEVEGYERVDIVAGDDFQIHGDVVADLTHLLAELVENAVSFSPPSASVVVSISRVGDDHLLSVSDAGVGMTDAQIADANDRIVRAGVEDETPSEFLGHYVIGRLAARHGIGVHLSAGLDGRGLVADVLVPMGAVVPPTGELVDQFDEFDGGALSMEPIVTEDASAPLVPTTITPEPSAAGPHDWSSVEHEVRQPASAAASASESFGHQPRRVPASVEPVVEPMATPAPVPTLAPVPEPAPAPALEPAPAPAPEPAPTLAPEPAPSPAPSPAPAPALAPVAPVPAAASAREAVTSSLAQLATPAAGSSFDYPPIEQIDPRQREAAPRTSAAPSVAETAPTSAPIASHEPAGSGLSAARDSASDAVEGALSAFGSARRTPGASLPDTSLTAALSGRMTLDVGRPPATDSTPPASEPLAAPSPNPDEIRFQLSGFQSGTSRADQEN